MLTSLQERCKHLRLAFLFKVVEDTVPAIRADNYLVPQRPKRAIRVKTFKDHVASNIMDSQLTNITRSVSKYHQAELTSTNILSSYEL